MNVEHLCKMANQIGDFFASQGGREQAVAGIADHLRRFWEPRMQREIVAHVAAGGAGLHDEVVEAVRRLQPPAIAQDGVPPAAASAGGGQARA